MSNSYTVAKPKKLNPKTSLAKSILVRIFFPPILLLDGLKLLIRKSLGNRIAKLILPAQTPEILCEEKAESLEIEAKHFKKQAEYYWNQYALAQDFSKKHRLEETSLGGKSRLFYPELGNFEAQTVYYQEEYTNILRPLDLFEEEHELLEKNYDTDSSQAKFYRSQAESFEKQAELKQAEANALKNREELLKIFDQLLETSLSQFKRIEAKKLTLITYDGAELDTLEVAPPNASGYIIEFAGNASFFEIESKRILIDAKKLGCNIIAFNYRGVNHSKGKVRSQDDLLTDGIAQVQRLLDKGVNPKNIILKGFSLGGAVSALVAKHFHDRGISLNLFNDRSFSTATNVAVGSIRTFGRSGHVESLWGKLLGWIAKPFIKVVLWLTNWQLDAASAYKKLPAGNKEYMLVRSDKKRRAEYDDDCCVSHYASLHQSLKNERKKEIKSQNKETVYARKMTAADPEEDAHCLPSRQLINRYKVNGTQFFYNFVKRVSSQSTLSNSPNSACTSYSHKNS